jgi:hypothetical protein
LFWIKKSVLESSIKAVVIPEKIKFTAKKTNVFLRYVKKFINPKETRTIRNAPESFIRVSKRGFIGGRKIRSEKRLPPREERISLDVFIFSDVSFAVAFMRKKLT